MRSTLNAWNGVDWCEVENDMPALAQVEEWLTWSIALLAVGMSLVATYPWNAFGVEALGRLGLPFGRFGSLAVVLVLTVALVALCLGVTRVARSVRARLGGGPSDG